MTWYRVECDITGMNNIILIIVQYDKAFWYDYPLVVLYAVRGDEVGM
jgi:hypothetical protein